MHNLTENLSCARYPRAIVLCTDLATDLVRRSARPLLVLDCQAPLLLGCVPHRDVSPFSYDTGRGVRAASLASHGQTAVLHEELTQVTSLGCPPCPLLHCCSRPPTPLLALQLALQQHIPPPLSSAADSSARQQLPARPTAAMLNEHSFHRNAAMPASTAATTAASSRTPSAATTPAMRTGHPSLQRPSAHPYQLVF